VEPTAFGLEQLLGQPLASLGRGRSKDVAAQFGNCAAQVTGLTRRLGLVEVVDEFTLQHASDSVAVVTEGPQRLVDLFGQHRLRQIRLWSEDRPSGGPEGPFWPAQNEKSGSGREGDRLPRRSPDLGWNVYRRPAGGLEPVDLDQQKLAAGYDFRPSGICWRTHSMVSLVVSIV
jgi:hypothetical protein